MSRCFPYPPSGYLPKKVRNEALIESIKLQGTREKAKEERKKEKRREKKEKKEKRKEKEQAGPNLSKSSRADKAHSSDKLWGDKKDKGRDAVTEQLEKSNLTEEHKQPICVRGPSSPSDSTGNSNKRKRQSLPTDESRGRGKIIRIRLVPSKKHNEQITSFNKQQLCSTAGRTDIPGQDKSEIARTGTTSEEKNCFTSLKSSHTVAGLPNGTRKGLTTSPSGMAEAAARGKTGTALRVNAAMTSMQREELQYRSLFENWTVPQLRVQALGPCDQEWLFQTKYRNPLAKRRLEPCSDTVSSSSFGSWLHVQYLQEADAYALPYTVPF